MLESGDRYLFASTSISSSVSTRSTREYGFSIKRVRGRRRSSSADSDGTPEKMITGTSAGVETTTSRPDPCLSRRSTTAATTRFFLSASVPSSAVSAVTTTNPCISRNFTRGRRTDTSSSTTSTRRAASLFIMRYAIIAWKGALRVRSCTALVSLVCLLGLAPTSDGTGQNRASPHENVTGTIDGAQLTITYGRPYMRGRTIFGGLVPYGRVWCPGADEATTLESTRALRVGDLAVPPGPHTIWMLPTPDAWTLVVSKEPSGFHTRYNASADLGRVTMQTRTLANSIEQLTFAIDRDSPSGGPAIRTMWEQTEVWAPIRIEP